MVAKIGRFFKISLRKKKPPLIINLKYKNQSDKNHVKAFYSSDQVLPGPDNGAKIVSGVSFSLLGLTTFDLARAHFDYWHFAMAQC